MKPCEAQVSKQIGDFMAHHGWRRVRMQRAVVPGQFSAGEPGCADTIFLRFMPEVRVGAALVLYVETKSPTDRRQCICAKIAGTRRRCTVHDQERWQRNERARGAQVWVVSSFDAFAAAYEKHFGWLHSGDNARGQLDMLMGGGK